MKHVALFLLFMSGIALLSPGCKKKHHLPLVHKAVPDTATKFLFAGREGNSKAVYLFNLKTNQYERFWSNPKESVVEVGTNEPHAVSYFITVTQAGRKGILPYFLNARLYIVDLRTLKIAHALKLGNGVQLVSFFENDSTISIAVNRLQSAMVSHVMQQKLLFTTTGSKISEQARLFDFTKDGFPPLPTEKVRLLSLDKNYSIDLNDKNAVLLRGGIEKTKLLAGESGQRLHSVAWSANGETLVFSTVDLSAKNKTLRDPQPQTASLYIFSLTESAMVRIIDGGGYKHFDVIGDIVIYDDNFGENSRIHLFSLKEKKEITTLRLPGGCGLQNIPELPDYGL